MDAHWFADPLKGVRDQRGKVLVLAVFTNEKALDDDKTQFLVVAEDGRTYLSYSNSVVLETKPA